MSMLKILAATCAICIFAGNALAGDEVQDSCVAGNANFTAHTATIGLVDQSGARPYAEVVFEGPNKNGENRRMEAWLDYPGPAKIPRCCDTSETPSHMALTPEGFSVVLRMIALAKGKPINVLCEPQENGAIATSITFEKEVMGIAE